MKIRLFLAALCLLLLPLCFAPSSSQFSAYASGYVIAFDGELIPCECDPNLEGYRPDCVCDATRANSQPPEKGSSLGSESLIILAALMLWWRIRV